MRTWLAPFFVWLVLCLAYDKGGMLLLIVVAGIICWIFQSLGDAAAKKNRQ